MVSGYKSIARILRRRYFTPGNRIEHASIHDFCYQVFVVFVVSFAPHILWGLGSYWHQKRLIDFVVYLLVIPFFIGRRKAVMIGLFYCQRS